MKHSYASAASRHLEDANILLSAARWDNAAYLAGYVVECGVKAIIEIAGIQLKKHLHQISRDHLLLVADLSLAARRYPIDLDPDVAEVRREWNIDLRYVETGTGTPEGTRRLVDRAHNVFSKTIGEMVLDGLLDRVPK